MSLTIHDLAQECITRFSAKGQMIATAESCTGGLIAGALTEIAGSSAVVDRGFVTYSNEAKTEMLNVPADFIAKHGAVSPNVAKAMAEGALAGSRAHATIAVTGIAGPGGGTADKPVGLVYLATAGQMAGTIVSKQLYGDIGRQQVREQTVIKALSMLLDQLDV